MNECDKVAGFTFTTRQNVTFQSFIQRTFIEFVIRQNEIRSLRWLHINLIEIGRDQTKEKRDREKEKESLVDTIYTYYNMNTIQSK